MIQLQYAGILEDFLQMETDVSPSKFQKVTHWKKKKFLNNKQGLLMFS